MTNKEVEEFLVRVGDILGEYGEHMQLVIGIYDKRGDSKRPDGHMAMGVEVVNLDVKKYFTAVLGSITEAMLRVSEEKGELPVEVPCGGTSDCYHFIGSALRAAAHTMLHMATDAEAREREEYDDHERKHKTHH